MWPCVLSEARDSALLLPLPSSSCAPPHAPPAYSPPLPPEPWTLLPTPDMLLPTVPVAVPLRRDLQLYALSKLCNVLFAREAARRWGPEIVVVSLHPGSSMLTNGGESAGLVRLWLWMMRPWTKSVVQGASTSVYAAVAQGLQGGEYLSDCDVSEDVHPDARDPAKAQELWEFSLRELRSLSAEGV